MSPVPPDPRSPRPPDRAVSLPLLETVYRIAALDIDPAERSTQLTIALREHTTDADAKTRLKWVVSRIWINPPEPAGAMISWAIEHPEHFPDRRLMHTGALLATVPFVGSVLGQLGRAFALNQTPTVPELRRRLVARWGETSTVREAVGKTITSLRRLEIVDGGGVRPVAPGGRMSATSLGAAWLTQAVMLHRQVGSLEVREAEGAPELFWVGQQAPNPAYPYLELHTESLNRRVWVARDARHQR